MGRFAGFAPGEWFPFYSKRVYADSGAPDEVWPMEAWAYFHLPQRMDPISTWVCFFLQ